MSLSQDVVPLWLALNKTEFPWTDSEPQQYAALMFDAVLAVAHALESAISKVATIIVSACQPPADYRTMLIRGIFCANNILGLILQFSFVKRDFHDEIAWSTNSTPIIGLSFFSGNRRL